MRDVLQGEEWTDGAITLAGLERLKQEMIRHKRVGDLKLAGLTEERQEVFAAAVAILLGLFTSLPIERMDYSDGALREGLLYEFEERLQHHDIRERTALALSTHYRIDKRQAGRVEQSVLTLFDLLSGPWEMPEDLSRHPRLGGATARDRPCHQLQRHSPPPAYILQHTDLPGFNQDDQALLAALVRFHRRGSKLSEPLPCPTTTNRRCCAASAFCASRSPPTTGARTTCCPIGMCRPPAISWWSPCHWTGATRTNC